MNVKDIIRTLEPLMPERAKHWKQTLEWADEKLSRLIEQQVRITARKTFGDDYGDALLLSLPPEGVARGTLNLGTVVYGKEQHTAGLFPSEMTQHTAILGRSGSGKTNIALNMLLELRRNRVPWLYLDWKRTARDAIPLLDNSVQVFTPGRSLSPVPFNPLMVPPGVEPRVYANHVIDMLGDAFALGDGAKSIIQQALLTLYQNGTPRVSELTEAVKSLETRERASGWKATALRALQSYELSIPNTSTRKEQEAFARRLLTGKTILELDALSYTTKKFLIPLLCFWLYSVRLAKDTRERLSLVVFLEEAHHTLYKGESLRKETLMNRMLRQCREVGIGFVILDQQAHTLSTAALGNCYATICMNQKDTQDINKAAGISLLDDRHKTRLSRLPVGTGVVKLQDRWHSPFLVRFPLVTIRKGSVTDTLLSSYISRHTSCSELRTRCKISSVDTARVRSPYNTVQDGAFTLLHDIITHPYDSVRDRYRRLGMSAQRGGEYKNQLIAHGLIIEHKIKTGRTYAYLPTVTEKAREVLSLGMKPRGRESLQHEYWKNHYARKLELEGWQVSVEHPRKIGATDVVATKKQDRSGEHAKSHDVSIAIEVETGKSDTVHNVKQNLLARHDTIVIVATNDEALDAVERSLAKAGLLIPERIEFRLRDKPIGPSRHIESTKHESRNRVLRG